MITGIYHPIIKVVIWLMYKILHLITDLDTGGAEMMLLKLAAEMDETRFKNVVISLTDEGTLGNRLKDIGCQVYSLNMNKGLKDIFCLYKLSRIIEIEKPNIVQTWLYHADLFGTIMAYRRNIPLVWNIRCSVLNRGDHSWLLFKIIGLLAWLSRRPQAVVVNSKAGKDWHEYMGYTPRLWAVIPNGFDTDIYKPRLEPGNYLSEELGIRSEDPLIGLVARFDSMKDHSNFLNSAAIVHTRHPEVHFILAGRGVDQDNCFLVNLVSKLGLGSVVHLLGERNDIVRLNTAFTLAVSSSYSEGFPTTIGEAMACGVPCVATDVGESANIIGDTGRVVPPSDSEALAEAILELINMPVEDLFEMGMAARNRIVELFSLDRVVSQYQDLYETIINKT